MHRSNFVSNKIMELRPHSSRQQDQPESSQRYSAAFINNHQSLQQNQAISDTFQRARHEEVSNRNPGNRQKNLHECVNEALNFYSRTGQIKVNYYALAGRADLLRQWLKNNILEGDENAKYILVLASGNREARAAYTRQEFLKACIRGDLGMTQALIDGGIDVNYVDKRTEHDEMTALMRAATGDHVPVMQALLLAGADINKRDEHLKETALIHAISLGNSKAAKFLIEWGADVNLANMYGTTPLMVAARFGRTETVKQLLLADANPHARNQKGKTALRIAQEQGHKDIVQLLMPLARNNTTVEVAVHA